MSDLTRVETVIDPFYGPISVLTSSTHELVALPSGAVSASLTVDANRVDPEATDSRARVSEDGSHLWVLATRWRTERSLCGQFTVPTFYRCPVANTLTAVSAERTVSNPLGPGFVEGFDLTPNGLLAVTDRRHPLPPVLSRHRYAPDITHAVHGRWEALWWGPEVTTSDGGLCAAIGEPTPCTYLQVGADTQIADDGLLLSATTMTGTGWIDYETPSTPEP